MDYNRFVGDASEIIIPEKKTKRKKGSTVKPSKKKKEK